MLAAQSRLYTAAAAYYIILFCWATLTTLSLKGKPAIIPFVTVLAFPVSASLATRAASLARRRVHRSTILTMSLDHTDSLAEGSAKPSPSSKPQVNLLDLASAAVACTVTASLAIKRISGDNAKNSRLKIDGSVVTDADFVAQGVICKAITKVSSDVKIMGEESVEEMAQHTDKLVDSDDNDDIRLRTNIELRLRYHKSTISRLPLAQLTDDGANGATSTIDIVQASKELIDPEECIVDASRVTVIVDPLDGTKSYAHGEYDCVSILIAIILDNEPCFGVIGKPFGYTGVSSILNTGCATIYGGPLIDGVFVAGGDPVLPVPFDATAAIEDLPRAVISGSRSKGLVHDFCIHLGEKGLVYPEPMLISGAGEKSLRLILQKKNEALWFFPKAGTSLWDVAAPDAILRALGGKMSDKFGRDMDYSKNRDEAENIDGVVACIDAKLHAECVRLFQEGDWGDRNY